ncbi:metallopeptidase TldD-related protein [Acidicapsa dinghuensis]|uniref:Metallopeptidase TldD-related protein n=1 Tax=Acidicapsa dinghuensis TaxID=2218256 RepID=A0ABW1ECD9_9BACT|nr:metallopeptidase TldD-related protein [Acidicapsa dinghuensis]
MKHLSLAASFVLLISACAALAASQSASPQQTRADAEKDPVLSAMLAELDRNNSALQLKGFDKPFFIQYRIEDIDDFQTHADFGASLGQDHRHQRVARVTVRVGNYKTDSSTTRGDGSVELTSLDNDPLALRAALWQATDEAYKAALSAYARKQAELKQVQTPPQQDDFSQEAPVISIEPLVKIDIDADSWAKRIAEVSGLYRTDSALKSLDTSVQYSSAAFQARAINTYLVSSEGAIVRKGTTSYEESFAVGTQAADGMHLDRSYGSDGVALTDLDSEAAFNSHAAKLVVSLADLRKAPLVEEEYHGPVLLSADSSADAIHTLVAGAVTAVRPELGTEARTQGPFASSYHTRVLPDFLDIVDDPSLASYNGKSLVGAYKIDDEGVPAQTVKLVADGRLENYLIGREPVRDFPKSNGHGRAALTGPAHPQIGVLNVTAHEGLTDDELIKKMLALAKDRGLKSVYYVDTLGPELTPRLLYKISEDGKRELVRGATLDDLDQRALRSGVLAAGKDSWVANYDGAVPETVLSPALLFDDVTIRRANEKNDKLPYYPAPQ